MKNIEFTKNDKLFELLNMAVYMMMNGTPAQKEKAQEDYELIKAEIRCRMRDF